MGGCHLIGGLLGILPHLIPVPSDGFSSLHHALDIGRGIEPADLWPTRLLAQCGVPTVDVALQLSKAGEIIKEVAPPQATRLNLDLPAKVAKQWDAARLHLDLLLEQAKSASGEPSLLLWLAWRLGWECGAVVRTLHA